MSTTILREDFNLEKVTKFSLDEIKREDIINYPDDINEAFNTNLSFGGYKEIRSFYKNKVKIIHTGLDVFLKYKEKIFFPFDGLITNILYLNPKTYQVGNGSGTQVISWHSFNQVKKILGIKKTNEIFKNKKYLKVIYIHLDFDYFKKMDKVKFKNKNIGNKILKHSIVNKQVKKGDLIGFIGSRFNNGGWAPHVHIEASLHDEIEAIDFNDQKDLMQKIALGTVLYKDQKLIDQFNLIDPNSFLEFNKIANEEKVMSLKNLNEQPNIVSIKNLSLSYDKKTKILDNINFNIKKGDIVAILGPSGCGKTSLLNAISGFINYKGEVKISNINAISNIGYVFQDNLVYNSISVYKNVYIGAFYNFKYKFYTYTKIWESAKLSDEDFQEMQNIISLFKMYLKKIITKSKFEPRYKKFIKNFNKNYFKINFKQQLKQDVEKIMKILKIDKIAKQKPTEISGGQKQRLAIAKAIIKKPEILIMDEPLSSLDAKIKDQTRNWIKEIQKYFKITLIFVTHDQNDALLISNKILLMNKKGQIEQYDTPSNIFKHPLSEFSAKFIGWPEINLVDQIKNKKYYVRPQNIKINNKLKSNFKILDKKTTGHNFIYEGVYKKKHLRIFTSKKFNVDDEIHIYWKKESEIVLNAEVKKNL